MMKALQWLYILSGYAIGIFLLTSPPLLNKTLKSQQANAAGEVEGYDGVISIVKIRKEASENQTELRTLEEGAGQDDTLDEFFESNPEWLPVSVMRSYFEDWNGYHGKPGYDYASKVLARPDGKYDAEKAAKMTKIRQHIFLESIVSLLNKDGSVAGINNQALIGLYARAISESRGIEDWEDPLDSKRIPPTVMNELLAAPEAYLEKHYEEIGGDQLFAEFFPVVADFHRQSTYAAIVSLALHFYISELGPPEIAIRQ